MAFMLAKEYDGRDPTGWYMSEKLDGVRAKWDGKNFISRQGNIFQHHPDFPTPSPDWDFDGELYIAHKQFSQTVSIVKRKVPTHHWLTSIRYMVFDVFHTGFKVEDRHALLISLAQYPNANFTLVPQYICEGHDDLSEYLDFIQAAGGEGVMLKQPFSHYIADRTDALLKVKTFQYDTMTVTGYQPGEGKHQGRMGALIGTDTQGRIIKLGTGFTDTQREFPPDLGMVVKFKYLGRSEIGQPRHPVYVGEKNGWKWTD